MSEEQSYEVSKVLASQKVGGTLYYLVQWKGQKEEEATWEPIQHMANCQNAIQEFEGRKSKKDQKKRSKFVSRIFDEIQKQQESVEVVNDSSEIQQKDSSCDKEARSRTRDKNSKQNKRRLCKKTSKKLSSSPQTQTKVQSPREPREERPKKYRLNFNTKIQQSQSVPAFSPLPIQIFDESQSKTPAQRVQQQLKHDMMTINLEQAHKTDQVLKDLDSYVKEMQKAKCPEYHISLTRDIQEVLKLLVLEREKEMKEIFGEKDSFEVLEVQKHIQEASQSHSKTRSKPVEKKQRRQ